MADNKIAEGCVQAADHAIEHAPKKDVGTFLKMVGVAIFVLALAVGIALIVHGSIGVNTDAKIEVNKKSKDSPKDIPSTFKKEINVGNSGAAATTSEIKIIQEVTVKPPKPSDVK